MWFPAWFIFAILFWRARKTIVKQPLGPPTPGVQSPTPAQFFPSYPAPFFFFLPGTPAQNSDSLPPPPTHLTLPPVHFSSKAPPTPVPLTPGSPVLPHVSNKTSYEILWSLEAMRPWLYNLSHSCRGKLPACTVQFAAEVHATFQSDRTILNTNLMASKNLRDLTMRRLIRCFNIWQVLYVSFKFQINVTIKTTNLATESSRDLKIRCLSDIETGPWNFDWAERWTGEMWNHEHSIAWWNYIIFRSS